MANLNRIILVGKLTENPETRFTMDGIPMTKFTLGISRFGKGMDLVPVIAWRKLAEICGEYLKKDKLVLVEGRIQVRSFLTQTGAKRWQTEVVAKNMQMLEKDKTAPLPQPAAHDLEQYEELPETEVF